MRKLVGLAILAVIALGGSALLTRTSAQAGVTDRCSSLPKACHYTLQDGCCVADPQFDCFDLCF